ncbi:MAG TPA: MFS transporter [Candidatus Goldiibacteriota bacterium]|nr:MFS transporter [Candidatus Goldiibacteriota bacterium]
MKKLFKNKNFVKFFFVEGLEQLGDSFLLMSLIAWVMTMKENGSSSANMSLLMFWIGLPIVLFGPFAGVIVDRYKKKKVLVFSALSISACIFLIFLFTGKTSASFVFLLIFIKSLLSQIFIPARSSLIPHLVDERELLDANSFSASFIIIVQMITYAFSGIVISEIGYKICFLIDFFIYILVIVILLFIKENETVVAKKPINLNEFKNEFITGLKFLFSSEKILFVVRRVFILLIALGFIYVSIMGSFLSSVLNATGLKMQEIKALGFIQGFLGIGLALGVLIVKYVLKFFKEEEVIRSLYPIIGIFIASLYFWRNFYYLIAISILGGIAGIMILSIAETEIQKNTNPEVRGRIFSVYYILRGAGLAAATSLTGLVAKVIREDQIILICGIVLFVYGLIAFFAKRGSKIGRDKNPAA